MSKKVDVEKVVIYGKTYVPESAAPTGTRAVVVVDRGWIFAGDVSRVGGNLILDRAVHVRKWTSGWFGGMLENPKNADIGKMTTQVVVPEASVIFSCPVGDSWGL